jgi:flavin-dependent dehydrogenase
VEWNGLRQFKPFGQDRHGVWHGFQAWRAEFDRILLGRACDVGITVLQPCRAIRPFVKAGRVEGAITSGGFLSSAFVVDAAGSRHWLARHLGLTIEAYSPRLIACYGYIEGKCSGRNEAPAIVRDENGWIWTARVGSGLYAWTRFTLHDEEIPADWLPSALHDLQPWGKTRRADVTWRIVTLAAGLGYYLVGDAAAVLDPASSHGMLKAIMSGMMAAQTIVQIVQHQLDETQAAYAYNRWVYDWFEHNERRLRELYRVL